MRRGPRPRNSTRRRKVRKMKEKEFLALARFEGLNVKLTDLVAGGSFMISYDLSPKGAHIVGLPRAGTVFECVVKNCKPNPVFKETMSIELFIPKWGIIVDGGFVPSSQLGWFFITTKPRKHKD